MILVSILDTVAHSFYKPFMAHNIADATRQLSYAAAEPGSMLAKSPADYRGVHVADFDTETGIVTPVPHAVVPFQVSLAASGISPERAHMGGAVPFPVKGGEQLGS